MKKFKRYQNKTLRDYRNTAEQNTWSREAWVEQVLKIAILKYNLEDSDIERYVEKKRKAK